MERLQTDLAALRDELRDFRTEIRVDLVRLEAKIDGKPSLMAMFTGILVTVFGMAGVIASTVGTLHTLGMLR